MVNARPEWNLRVVAEQLSPVDRPIPAPGHPPHEAAHAGLFSGSGSLWFAWHEAPLSGPRELHGVARSVGDPGDATELAQPAPLRTDQRHLPVARAAAEHAFAGRLPDNPRFLAAARVAIDGPVACRFGANHRPIDVERIAADQA